MKWLVLSIFVVTTSRCCLGSVLRCSPGTQDPLCLEEQDILPPVHASKKESGKETGLVDAACLVGSEWESNCHYCRCSDSGVAECLKQDTCDKVVFADPIHCKPNTTFQRDCNTCVCLENGLGLCTLEYCRSAPLIQKQCAPGTSWKSSCNTCYCHSTGIASCTRKGCFNSNERTLSCQPGSTWTDSCNTCSCSEDGRAVCTTLRCSRTDDNTKSALKSDKIDTSKPNGTLSRKVRAFQQEPAKACQPGQEFRMDCNKCLCDNEGQDFSCTRMDCTAMSTFANARSKRELTEQLPMKCVPGSVFDQGCNVCRCTKDGQNAVCTLKRCKDPADTEAHIDTDPSGFRCNAGEQFKQGCNDCTCSADGKSVFCTIRLCDQDIATDI